MVTGAQTMPEVWRMIKAIFSAVQSEAATIRSPSPSRSSSSVTTTISPLANACRTSGIGWAMGHALECDDDHMAHSERQRNLSPGAAQHHKRVYARLW